MRSRPCHWRRRRGWTTPPSSGRRIHREEGFSPKRHRLHDGERDGGLVQLPHLLWTHLLDQADYARFAILEGVVFAIATATVTLAPQLYVLVYLHKKPRSDLAGDLGGLLGVSLCVGGLTTLAVLLLPDSFFLLEGEAIPRWAVAGVVVAATIATARIMA